MRTEQIVFASRPNGTPSLDNFRFENIELPKVQSGEVLLRGSYYSVDPFIRGIMNDAKLYLPSFQIDQPVTGSIVAEVLESKSDDFKTGDKVVGMLPWAKEFVRPVNGLQKINKKVAPLSYYLSILGMTGLAANFGISQVGKPKVGDTVVISGAASSVGIVAGQIAKILGCNVIGLVDSDKKIRLLREEFGFDDAINYTKATDLKNAIKEVCPSGVDIYFDVIGDEISDAVIRNLNINARIALFEQMAPYNTIKAKLIPRIQAMLFKKNVLMESFIVGDFQNQFPEAIKQLTQWVTDGKLKFTITISYGFNQLPKALLGLFQGGNTAKILMEE